MAHALGGGVAITIADRQWYLKHSELWQAVEDAEQAQYLKQEEPMSNYIIESISEPKRYWTGHGWEPGRERAWEFNECERRTGELPKGGCWVIVNDKPDRGLGVISVQGLAELSQIVIKETGSERLAKRICDAVIAHTTPAVRGEAA